MLSCLQVCGASSSPDNPILCLFFSSHLLSSTCYYRRAHFDPPDVCDLFVQCLESMRWRFAVWVCGYVVMPEHVHLLVDGPEGAVIRYRFANSWTGQERPSAAEAACIGGPSGTAEAVPFPSYPTKNLFGGAQPILQS